MLTLYFIFNIFILFTFNFSVIKDLNDEWMSAGPYNHGFLGLGLAIYIFWVKRDFFTSTHPNILGLLFLGLANILFLIANLANIGQLQILSLSLIILFLCVSIYGFTIINKFLLAWLILLLTLPIWQTLQVPLQELSTWVSFHSVNALGFEITRSGYHLMTQGGVFVVEPACSGLGFFLTSAVYALFVTQLNKLSYRKGALFTLLALSFAIFANWLRIIIIVIVGSKTHTQNFIVQDHLTFGWFVFMACFIPLIVIGQLYFPEQSNAGHKEKSPSKEGDNLSLWAPISASLIIIIFTASTVITASRFDDNYKFILPQVPFYTHINANGVASHTWSPVSKGVTTEEFSYFLQGEDLFQVYLANYVKQSQGNEMIFINNRLFNKDRWYNAELQTIPLAQSPLLKKISLLTLQKNNFRSRLIAYWYLIDGRFVTDKKAAKWYEVQAALKGQPGATLIAVAFDFQNGDKQQAIKAITRFTEALSSQPINIQKSI